MRLLPQPVSLARFGHKVSAGSLLLALAVGALTLWILWPVPVLEIRAGQDGRLLRTVPIQVGDRITYRYLHSVQKAPVDEIMEVGSNGHLVVRETIYEMVGAGLPSDCPDGEMSFDASTRKFRIVGMSRDISPWRVRVAFTAEQALEVRGDRLRLDCLAEPTTLLVIDVAFRPRAAMVLRRGQG